MNVNVPDHIAEALAELLTMLQQARKKQLREDPVTECAPPTQKTCRLCFKAKPLSEYYKNKLSSDMLTTACKACLREQVRKNYDGLKKKIKAREARFIVKGRTIYK